MRVRRNPIAPSGLLVDRGEVSRSDDSMCGEGRLDAGTTGGFGEPNDEDEPADGSVGQGGRR